MTAAADYSFRPGLPYRVGPKRDTKSQLGVHVYLYLVFFRAMLTGPINGKEWYTRGPAPISTGFPS